MYALRTCYIQTYLIFNMIHWSHSVIFIQLTADEIKCCNILLLKTGNSTVTLISNLRIYLTLVNEYLLFAHFFSSFICFIYYIVQSNISICLSTFMFSYNKRLWVQVSYFAIEKITKSRSIELTVIKRRNFFFWLNFYFIPQS